VPEREEPFDGIFEAFCKRDIFFIEVFVAGVIAGVTWVGFFKSGRSNVVASAPDVDLLWGVFLCGFGFIKALECTVVAFIEPPGINDGQIHQVHTVEDNPEGSDGAF